MIGCCGIITGMLTNEEKFVDLSEWMGNLLLNFFIVGFGWKQEGIYPKG